MKGKIVPRGFKRVPKARSGEKTTHKPHWFQKAVLEPGGTVNPDGPKGQLPMQPQSELA
jgi:hypothetical protein